MFQYTNLVISLFLRSHAKRLRAMLNCTVLSLLTVSLGMSRDLPVEQIGPNMTSTSWR